MMAPEEIKCFLDALKCKMKIPRDEKFYERYTFDPSDYCVILSYDKKQFIPLPYVQYDYPYANSPKKEILGIHDDLGPQIVHFLKFTKNDHLVDSVVKVF